MALVENLTGGGKHISGSVGNDILEDTNETDNMNREKQPGETCKQVTVQGPHVHHHEG